MRLARLLTLALLVPTAAVADEDTGSSSTNAPTIDLTSTVSVDCIEQLYQSMSGKPAGTEAPRWADACRNFEISHRCKVTASQPDSACFDKLNYVITGSFSDSEAAAATTACQQIQATCPSLPNTESSKVDLACLDDLYSKTQGKPDPKAMRDWLGRCRTKAFGKCVVVGGAVDLECVRKAYDMITGKFTSDEAAAVGKACRAVDLRCD
jgi:hypothetical protein